MEKPSITSLFNVFGEIAGKRWAVGATGNLFWFFKNRIISDNKCLKSEDLKGELDDYKRFIDGNEYDNQMFMKNVTIAAMGELRIFIVGCNFK